MTTDITKVCFEKSEPVFLNKTDPAVILISGEDYKEFTARFQKPFDELFTETMQETLKGLCEEIKGCIFGYTKAFDLVLLLEKAKENEEDIIFYNDVQKIASRASSLATVKFNKIFEKKAKSYVLAGNNFDETRKLSAMQGYVNSIDKGAVFNARCFNIDEESIEDYFFEIQKESIEDGIRLMGEAYCKAEELEGKSASEIQFMVFDRAGVNFDSYQPEYKRGSACVRSLHNNIFEPEGSEALWNIERDMPLLKPESRELFRHFVFFENSDHF